MIINANRYILSFACLIFCTLTINSGVSAETLDEAISKSINNHPRIKALQASEKASLQEIDEEESAYYPTVSAAVSFGRIYADNTTTRGLSVTRGEGYSWFGEGSGSLSQSLYDWSATKMSVNAAKSRNASAGALYMSQKTLISMEAAQAYIQLLRAQKIHKKAMANQSAMEDYYSRIQSAFDNDGADESELSRAQDIVSLAKNSVLQYEGEVKIAEASYKEVVGALPEASLVEPSINLSYIPDSLDLAVAKAMDVNAQIKSANYDAEASGFDARREKTNKLPNLNAELSYLKRDQEDLIGGESVDARAVVRLNWDYSLGGAQSAAEKRVALVQKELQYNSDALKRTITRDVEVAWISKELAARQKLNESDRLKAAEKTLETYKEQYEGAQRSILDLMTVENSLFATEQDYLNMVYQEMSAVFSLMGVIGLPFDMKQTKDDSDHIVYDEKAKAIDPYKTTLIEDYKS